MAAGGHLGFSISPQLWKKHLRNSWRGRSQELKSSFKISAGWVVDQILARARARTKCPLPSISVLNWKLGLRSWKPQLIFIFQPCIFIFVLRVKYIQFRVIQMKISLYHVMAIKIVLMELMNPQNCVVRMYTDKVCIAKVPPVLPYHNISGVHFVHIFLALVVCQ